MPHHPVTRHDAAETDAAVALAELLTILALFAMGFWILASA